MTRGLLGISIAERAAQHPLQRAYAWHDRAAGTPRDTLREQRDAQVLMGRMGTAWETAKVAVFLA
jgi:hypothetical protein